MDETENLENPGTEKRGILTQELQLQEFLQQPALVESTQRFKQLPLVQVDGAFCVYVSQREFATASKEQVKIIGTDETTTCIGLAMRNPETSMTSVAHLDSVRCVEEGVSRMIASLQPNDETVLEIHMVGAFDDSMDSKHTENGCHRKGFSWPLASRLVETLHSIKQKLDIRTACILHHNTAVSDTGYAVPVFRGFSIEVSSGLCMPASFTENAKGPDDIVRGLYLYASTPGTRHQLANPYNTCSDSFEIGPYTWEKHWKNIAARLLMLPDNVFLETCSTSPRAESAGFVSSMKRLYTYLYHHPSSGNTFPNRQARRFLRAPNGYWQCPDLE